MLYCAFHQQGAQGAPGTDGLPGAKGDQVCLNNDDNNDDDDNHNDIMVDILLNCIIPDQFLATSLVGQATIVFLTCAC